MSNNYSRDYHEKLLLNSGGSITKTIHNINVDATAEQIKDIILHNHSNLKHLHKEFMLSILSNRNQMKPCRPIIADTSDTISFVVYTVISHALRA